MGIRRAAVVVVACLACACATETVPKLTPAQEALLASDQAAAAARAQAAAHGMDEARQRAQTECDALDAHPVGLPERHAVGAAMASVVIKTTPLYGDAPATPVSALSSALPHGPKNDVVAYVQRIGAKVAPKGPVHWTFGVLDEPNVRVYSNVGGFVFVTKGVLATLKNEADLALALALGVSRVSGERGLDSYVKARKRACLTALVGLYLVEAGAESSIPGAGMMVADAKFGKTMQKFSSPDGFDPDKDPDVDHDFIAWFVDSVVQMQRLAGVPTIETLKQADAEAADLFEAAGYDGAAFERATVTFTIADSHARERAEALAARPVKPGGKSPPFPPKLDWPR